MSACQNCNCSSPVCCDAKPGLKGDQGPIGEIGPRGLEGPTVRSADSGNLVTLGSDTYLMLSAASVAGAGFIKDVTNSPTATLTKIGTSNVKVDVKRSLDAGNQIQERSDGLYVPVPSQPTREFIEDILASTFPQFVYDDNANTYTFGAVPMTSVTGFTPGCGLQGAGTSTNALRLDRTAIIGTTANSSLEAGAGTCDINVKIDNNTIKRAVNGSLTVFWAAMPNSQVRQALSAPVGPVSFNPTTGVIGLVNGTASGNVLTWNGSNWVELAVPGQNGATFAAVAGAGIDVVAGGTAGHAPTFSVKRSDLIGNTAISSLKGGTGSASLIVAVDGSSVDRDSSGNLRVLWSNSPLNATVSALDGRVVIAENKLNVHDTQLHDVDLRVGVLETRHTKLTDVLTWNPVITQDVALSYNFNSLRFQKISPDCWYITGRVVFSSAGTVGYPIVITGIPGNPTNSFETAVGSFDYLRTGVGFEVGTTMLSHAPDKFVFRIGGTVSGANYSLGTQFAVAVGDALSFNAMWFGADF